MNLELQFHCFFAVSFAQKVKAIVIEDVVDEWEESYVEPKEINITLEENDLVIKDE